MNDRILRYDIALKYHRGMGILGPRARSVPPWSDIEAIEKAMDDIDRIARENDLELGAILLLRAGTIGSEADRIAALPAGKEGAEAAIVIEDIIGTLARIDRVEGLFERLKVALSDEAVYEHLHTCADVLDDEDDKTKLRDFAEFYAFQFCKGT